MLYISFIPVTVTVNGCVCFCQNINRSHAHAHDSRTNHSHEHRARSEQRHNDADTRSRSRRRRPQFFFFFFSCHTTITPQTARAQSEKLCRRRSASSGQKTRRGIEGEKPGRRRYREVLLPEMSLIEEKSSERPSPKSRRSVPQHPPSSKSFFFF